MVLTVLVCFTATPFHASAYGKDSEKRLPYTGAVWKTWAQGNTAWKNVTIGNGTTATMGQQGCVLTSVAMAAKSYRALLQGTTTDSVTPLTFVNKCKSVGTVTSTGSYIWGNTSLALQQMSGSSSWKQEGLTTISSMTTKVNEYLNKTDGQYIVIVCFGGQHYVVADYVSSGTLYVFDPAVGAVTTLQTALNRKSSYTLTGFFYLKYTGTIRGDVDENGIIDSTDARLVLQYANGTISSLANPIVADFNADGVVNGTDATLLLQSATLK